MLWGRALETVPVTDVWGRTVRVLMPDALTPLEPLDPVLVRLADGFAPRRCLQPIARLTEWAAPAAPGWAQVAAPYATVHQWCAPGAPLTARPGWGAVLYASDQLTIGGETWLGLGASQDAIAGWSPAALWTTADTAFEPGDSVLLAVERDADRIRAVQGDTTLWTAGAAIPGDLLPGDYALAGRAPIDPAAQTGAPWALDFGAWRTYGAYWHNSFGTGLPVSHSVELPVLAARALYSLPIRAARVT